ncbi:Isoquinoline 1-oxidoreductase subunit [Rhizobium halophytocola]|uniref:Cytochrome c5 n=1 Tax=Rhizobium halophytocola TaxID=735519 RepID=A0ABS4E0S5_9HYPH|nr:Isoquinoline 1-oxidoreductase subunit [Rhizobium halophytocola]MBP1851533.1 cytochrome c5 [Rhizobium halophytocola]
MASAALVAAGLVLAGIAGVADSAEVELRAPDAFADIGDGNARSKALFTEMGKVIESPRCMNCHPRTDRPTQHEGLAHTPPVLRGPDGRGVAGLECSTCHGAENVTFPDGKGSIPGHEDWHLAPRSMGWQGLDLSAICAQIKDPERNGGRSMADLVHHNAEDTLVGWAWNPGIGRMPAPGSQQLFGELTRAWIASGAACPDPLAN